MENKIDTIWGDFFGKKMLLIAMVLSLLTHGVILYFTLPKTYDAYVHMFFADHYARFWFEPWEYRWYTGFLTISYPPLVHQIIALLSKIFPLKVAFVIYANLILQILIIGVYRFSKLFYSKTIAGVAALLVVVLSSIVETLHVYGQMPTLTGLAFLLNSLPFLYLYIRKQKGIYLIMALSFLAVVVSAHHVTAIFGMAFFIAPTLWMALTDCIPENKLINNRLAFVFSLFKQGVLRYKQIILFGGLILFLTVGLIFPYWYWSKNYPITQVSIPHGSRDNFLEKTSSGLIFFIIPLILIFSFLPAICYSISKKKRFFGWAVAFFVCLLLGSGGTTPFPKLLLGNNAFNILTLDRFGFWASIIALPFMAKFILSFVMGPVQQFWVSNFGKVSHFILSGSTGFAYFLFIIFVFHLGTFRPLQPKEITIQPILNFLNRDEHMRWRYLTLGFGDQMAWLSSNSLAATVDGNYHSARRLPELTSRPIERLENAKFSGDAGLASLNDFLVNAEKYNLKYVFCNDRYYDPLLYYSGWSRTIRLENGIMVWEKGNISTIKPIIPIKIDPLLKYAWGTLPVLSLILAIFLGFLYLRKYKETKYPQVITELDDYYPKTILFSSAILPLVFCLTFIIKQLYEQLFIKEQDTPLSAIQNYYNHLDFQRFEDAFRFFVPSPTFTLDQYLLEKSVSDGGIMPSYVKLDSISIQNIQTKGDYSLMKVYTNWNSALGQKEKIDTIGLTKINKKWYINPKKFIAEIPEYQMRAYTFTLFKKQGKRHISSFPTVKDDRVKKAFAAFLQINLVKKDSLNYLTGEFINADDIPINLGLKARVHFKNNKFKDYYPSTAIHYNLSPKASTFFQIDLDNAKILDSLKVQKIELFAETDVTERGYIHGGVLNYSIWKLSNNRLKLKTEFYDELSADINIPGVLVAQKNISGQIIQTKLILFDTAIRSGLNLSFATEIQDLNGRVVMNNETPIDLFINGHSRKALPLKNENNSKNMGVYLLPHCFVSQEIFLQ